MLTSLRGQYLNQYYKLDNAEYDYIIEGRD